MKIRTITIHNFRSIIDATIYLGDYTILVGANNSGKSNIIDALLVFYEKSLKYVDERDFPKLERLDNEVWIEIEYELDLPEAEDLKKEYLLPNDRLKVRKIIKTEEERSIGIHGYIGDEISDELFYGAKGVQQGKLGDVIYIPAVSRIDDETKLTGPSPLRDILSDIFESLV
ncbi:MAG: AAA family ATPase, partial [Anaerolineales bacterium]